MTLRHKTLMVIGAIFACLVLMLYLFSRIILTASFTDLEEQYVQQDVEQALSIVSGELTVLDTILFDWVAWGNHVLAEGITAERVAPDLVEETLTTYRLNLLLLVDPAGQIVFGKAVDLSTEEEVPLPPSLHQHLTEDGLLRGPHTEDGVKGIVLLPEGPWLIASRPIVTGDEEGAIEGALVIGRYLNAVEIGRLAELSRLSLTVRPFNDPHMPADFQLARSSLSATFPGKTSVFVHPLNSEKIAGYALLRDIYGKPALVLRVDMPREIYQRGQTSMLSLVLLLLVSGLAFTGLSSLIADRAVISRLVRLNADVKSIGESGDLTARVSMAGQDELASLAKAINGMLTALELSHARLQESEERFRTLVESMDDLVFTLDREQRYTGVFGPWLERTSLSPEELLGKTGSEVVVTEETAGCESASANERALAGENVVYEWSAKGMDDGLRHFQISLSPLRDSAGAVVGIVGVGRDITERKQAEEALKQRNRELATLYQAATAISSDLSLEVVLQTVAEQLARAFDSGGCALSLWRREENAVETLVDYNRGWPDETEPAGTTYDLSEYPATRRVLETSRPVVIRYDDPAADEAELALMKECDTYTLLMLPLVARDRVLGLVELLDDVSERDYTPEEIRLAESLAAHAAVAIENARLYEQAQQEIAERKQVEEALRHLVEFEKLVTTIAVYFINLAPEDIDGGIDHALQAIGEFVGADYGHVFLLSGDRSQINNAYEWCAAGFAPRMDEWQGLSPQNLSWWMEKLKWFETIYVPRTADLPPQAKEERAWPSSATQAMVVSPLVYGGTLMGFLSFSSEQGETTWSDTEINLLKTAAGIIAGALMQKQALQALQESEQRFRDVARTTGDWIWEINAAGQYTYVSPVVEQVLGYTPQEVLGKRHADFVSPDAGDRGEVEMKIQEIIRQGEPFIRRFNPCVHKNGHTVVLESTGLPLTDAQGRVVGYRGVHRDITAERRMEERLSTVYLLGRELVLSRDKEQVAQITVDAARLLFDCHLCELWLANEKEGTLVCQAHNTTEQRAEDRPVSSLEDRRSTVMAVAQSGEPVYVPDVSQDPRHVDVGMGTRSVLCVPLKVSGRAIGVLSAESENVDAFGENDRQLFANLADQAALAIENAQLYEQMRTARDHLQSLSNRLVEVQETERRHIARELHDEIGQILTGLKLLVEMSIRLPAGEVATNLEEALTLIHELMERVRNLSLSLRPAPLDDLGLLPTLRWHLERYTAQTNVRVALKHAGVEGRRFASEVEMAAYRVVQEALTNVARHAGVSEVTTRLWADRDTLGVQIEDRGVGFDVESALTKGASSGLPGMQERVALLGGQLTIDSAPGTGTRVTAEFPLGESASAPLEADPDQLLLSELLKMEVEIE